MISQNDSNSLDLVVQVICKKDPYQLFRRFRDDEHPDADRDEDDAEDEEEGHHVPGGQERTHRFHLLLAERAVCNLK
jgi:hypothetical protein